MTTGGYGETVRRLVAGAAKGGESPCGEIEDAEVRVERTNPVCGDILRIEIRTCGAGAERRVERIAYRAFGCPPLIASAEVAVKRLEGEPIERLLSFEADEILGEIPDLPPSSRHAAELAAEAIRAVGEALCARAAHQDAGHQDAGGS